jgi:hypothetical protein
MPHAKGAKGETDRSRNNVELHIISFMLSLQKCEVDARNPGITRQTLGLTQHLRNRW